MNVLLFFIITLSATPLHDFFARSYFVIWNVGQGQWLTQITADHCQHFDMGGEFFPWKKLHQVCGDKPNEIHLSHWDWDHVGALSKPALKRSLPRVCLALAPLGKSSRYKESLVSKLPPCTLDRKEVRIWTPQQMSKKDSNAQSHIVSHRQILIPGDSTAAAEKVWSQISWVRPSRILILGHHGSRTSSSEELLQAVPDLKLSVASARWARYKHPHPQVLARLRQHQVPVLRTEDWGNIWIEGP